MVGRTGRSGCGIALVLALATAGCASTNGSVETFLKPEVEGAPIQWLRVPQTADIREVYPPAALAQGVTGRVRINCRMTDAGGLDDCRVADEAPASQGFGAAALRLSPFFRFDAGQRPDLVDKRGTVRVTFVL